MLQKLRRLPGRLLREITLRLPLKVALPLMISLLVVTSVSVLVMLAYVQADRHRMLLVAALIVAAGLLLGILLGLYVAGPIIQLTEHVRNIGRGQLDREILLTEFPEFMHLSFAINRMVEGLRERLTLRRSLAMAQEVQQGLLPSTVPDYQGLDIAGRSYYCDETGGDYFDYLKLGRFPPDTAVIAIGDVSGHGIAAAIVMASARGILRSRSHDAESLHELLGHMNTQIADDSTGGRYMTMLLAAVNSVTGELRWTSAGHRPPLVADPNNGHCIELAGADIPLGITSDIQYQEFVHRDLRPGHILLLATDGLWEITNSAGKSFGLKRLEQILLDNAAQSAGEICGAIAMEVLTFCGGQPQKDDISFVVVKVLESGG